MNITTGVYVKSKVPVRAMKIRSFLTSALQVVDTLHAPGALPPGKEPPVSIE